MSLDINYNVGEVGGPLLESFRLNLCYDGGPCGISASLNGTDISRLITITTTASGQTMLHLDTTHISFHNFVSSWTERIDATAEIQSCCPASQLDHVIDFFSTFGVEVTSLDPNVVWQSQTGRQARPADTCASDTTPPTITVPPAVTASAGSACGAVVSDAVLGTATASDNCPGVTVSRSGVPAHNFFPVGTTVITHTATDARGNKATATQTVTVTDNTPPTVTCPPPITTEFMNAAGAPATFSPTASDNCSVATLTSVPPSGSIFPIGTTVVTSTATDPSGNRASCSFTVTVLGSRGVKQNVLGELTALRAPVRDEDDGEGLDEAIVKLRDSLNAAFWIDQVHLQKKNGQEVFEKEKESVENLQKLLKEQKSAISDTLLRGFIDRMVKVDRLLAEIAISEAIAAHGRPQEIADAQQELARGDAAVAAGKFARAIERYGEAWEHSVEALTSED